MSPNKNSIVEYTMNIGRVNLYVFLMIIPVLMIYLIPFILIWDFEIFNSGRKSFMNYFLPVLFFGIIFHELLHGITWSLFAPGGFRSVKFGIHWKFLTPYCHCKEPLKVWQYKLGGAMPLIIMGILPSVSGIITGNGAILFFGIFFTWAAGGDIISLFMLRKINNNSYVFDHPDKMGFYTKC